MTQAEIGLCHRDHGAAGHFQHLQRALVGRAERTATAEIDDIAELAANDGRQCVGLFLEDMLDAARQPTHRGDGVVAFATDKTEAGKQQVGEAAGHHQAAIIGTLVQHQHGHARIVAVARGELATGIAGDDQVAIVRRIRQQAIHHAGAFRAVARTRQRNQQTGSGW